MLPSGMVAAEEGVAHALVPASALSLTTTGSSSITSSSP